MFGSSVIAPVAFCTVIAAGATALNPADSPVFPSAATRTSTFQLTSMDSVDWNKSSLASAATVSGGSLPFGLPQVLAIMTALAAFNPDAAATMQFINTELLDQLAHGTPLGEAMVNVSLLLSPPVGDGPGSPLAPVLNQIGPMIALAPTVIGGAMTVLAAIPEAVIPVVAAVVVAVINTAAAAGSDGFTAAVEAGLYDVMTAAAKGIATMVNVVKAVLNDIAAVMTIGSTPSIAAEGLRVPGGVQKSGSTTKADAKMKRATASVAPTSGVANPRPRHSASAASAASSSRSASPAGTSGKRGAHPHGTKGTAKSAR
ncbi:conserved exported hypothetical protein [uncultured Mycobacterium sp.]|uniref:PE-PGRS family protein n=1 Tax=uncultured Mycobacterium sp. TaxID=171292 RepID=A0A1Y5PLB5_9MYCO|nr:conserved exported hypothetical protein [uncultured Mycobacterium sp.]